MGLDEWLIFSPLNCGFHFVRLSDNIRILCVPFTTEQFIRSLNDCANVSQELVPSCDDSVRFPDQQVHFLLYEKRFLSVASFTVFKINHN
jgi:hypothetical protein